MKKNNIEYKKINLREFRHNLTQLKDSPIAIYERGIHIGYYIPKQYDIEVVTGQEKKREGLKEALKLPLGHLKSQKNKNIDVNKEFKKLMIEKHSR